MVRSANFPIYRVINYFFILLIIVGFIFFFILLFQRPILIDGIIFIVFYIVFFAIVWYQASRIIFKLQLGTNGVTIQTLTSARHYTVSDTDKLLLKHFLSWIVFQVIKVSKKRNMNFFLYPYDVSGIAPMYYEANLKDAIEKYNNYISNGRLTKRSHPKDGGQARPTRRRVNKLGLPR